MKVDFVNLDSAIHLANDYEKLRESPAGAETLSKLENSSTQYYIEYNREGFKGNSTYVTVDGQTYTGASITATPGEQNIVPFALVGERIPDDSRFMAHELSHAADMDANEQQTTNSENEIMQPIDGLWRTEY